MRVLIADDHDLVRDALAAFLRAEGIEEVDVAANLPDAMDRATAVGGFDLVLLDYQMPGMNGLDGLPRMIEANGGRPVALLSGTASREVAEVAIRAGAAGYVPVTYDSLVTGWQDAVKFGPFEQGDLMDRARMPGLRAAAEGRILSAFLQPQPDDTVPRFDYEAHLAALTG
ncbi:MAG: YcjX family protein, partial [Sphingomonadales bacterium]|nr:YcjX family protein [Sphingomonadales bacterium]